MKLQLSKSEPQNIECRISNLEGWKHSRSAGVRAACRLIFFKTDSRHTFDIRFFDSFFSDWTGRFLRPAAGLTPAPSF
jgi:hypothetical protein